MTIMMVRRPSGQVERVQRPEDITDTATRTKFETATREAGRGDIISWEIVKPASRPVGSQRTANHGLYARGQARCKGCGRIGDDGECGRGGY